jgi:hypothetical protein
MNYSIQRSSIFSDRSYQRFERHINRLTRYTKIAKKMFPCLKGKEQEFLCYVLNREHFRYTPPFDAEQILSQPY